MTSHHKNEVNSSKGNESVRFKSSMSVDELDEMLMDLIADAIDFGHRDYSGPVREENERRDDYQELHKAKQAIHQHVTKKQIEEWKRACIDNWQCPIPEQYALDRLTELEKQLKSKEAV